MRLAKAMIVCLAAVGCSDQSGDPALVEARAAQIRPHLYRVAWTTTGTGLPVDVFVADRPYAPAAERRRIASHDTDGQTVAYMARAGRPYFYLAADRGGSGLWTAERVLPLEGGRNFRDLGGFRTRDGHRVKWGRLYRSGTMADLTPADYAYLSRLGIKVVCDLRSRGEREAEPNQWVVAKRIPYWTRDYEISAGDLRKLVAARGSTADQFRAAMIDTYRKLPFEQAPAFREMFRRLAAGEIPLAFNCSAGKDRTGTAAALILSALGVPRDTIVEDYALTDKIVDLSNRAAGRSRLLASSPKGSGEALAPIYASDPGYIRAMFAAVEERHGSVDTYFHEVLGLSDDQLASMRKQLLEADLDL